MTLKVDMTIQGAFVSKGSVYRSFVPLASKSTKLVNLRNLKMS